MSSLTQEVNVFKFLRKTWTNDSLSELVSGILTDAEVIQVEHSRALAVKTSTAVVMLLELGPSQRDVSVAFAATLAAADAVIFVLNLNRKIPVLIDDYAFVANKVSDLQPASGEVH